MDENSFLQTVVIQRTLPFELHAADAHANPLVDLLKQVDAC